MSTSVGRDRLRLACDARLVELCREEHDGAFETIVDRYRAPLIGYCRRFVSAHDAEDLVQLVFERTLPILLDTERELNLKAWLYRVAHNAATKLKQRKREFPAEEIVTGAADSPQATLENAEQIAAVVTAIGRLPTRQRTALLLREFEGRSYAQMADMMDSNSPNARKLVQLARARLRDTLATPA